LSAASVVTVVAFLTAVVALFVSVRAGRRLMATQAEFASANTALDQERRTTAESIAAVHRSTVEEVTTLLENVLDQVDTDISAKVAEALALLSSGQGSSVDEADRSLTGTSTHEQTER
jgi:actin-like ATPase involved in cell morphogenesis